MGGIAGLGHLFVCVFLYHFSATMVTPAITDVTMAALCPGRDQCSLAIYLTGAQQAVMGMGALMVTPFVGNLSDMYGRKALLTLPMMVSVIPLVTLAYSRTKTFFLIYYSFKILVGILCQGSMQCLPVAYVADKVDEQWRASAIGILSGVYMAGTVVGTLTSHFLSTTFIFRVSAVVAVAALVYMRLFLVESSRTAADAVGSSQPILASMSSESEAEGEPLLLSSSKGPSFWDMISLLRSSLTLSRAAVLAFLSCVVDEGFDGNSLYYLKARFHFNKDQYADLQLIIGVAGVVSQLFLMPIVVPTIGETKLLSISFLASCIEIFLYSIAWASWVPYLASTSILVRCFGEPCLRSLVSKRVRSSAQGTAQGCISGIISFASILSPLLFTPLTALFLSENAPFYFPGFSFVCAGFVAIAAFIQSIMTTWPEAPMCSH